MQHLIIYILHVFGTQREKGICVYIETFYIFSTTLRWIILNSDINYYTVYFFQHN